MMKRYQKDMMNRHKSGKVYFSLTLTLSSFTVLPLNVWTLFVVL